VQAKALSEAPKSATPLQIYRLAATKGKTPIRLQKGMAEQIK